MMKSYIINCINCFETRKSLSGIVYIIVYGKKYIKRKQIILLNRSSCVVALQNIPSFVHILFGLPDLEIQLLVLHMHRFKDPVDCLPIISPGRQKRKDWTLKFNNFRYIFPLSEVQISESFLGVSFSP